MKNLYRYFISFLMILVVMLLSIPLVYGDSPPVSPNPPVTGEDNVFDFTDSRTIPINYYNEYSYKFNNRDKPVFNFPVDINSAVSAYEWYYGKLPGSNVIGLFHELTYFYAFSAYDNSDDEFSNVGFYTKNPIQFIDNCFYVKGPFLFLRIGSSNDNDKKKFTNYVNEENNIFNISSNYIINGFPSSAVVLHTNLSNEIVDNLGDKIKFVNDVLPKYGKGVMSLDEYNAMADSRGLEQLPKIETYGLDYVRKNVKQFRYIGVEPATYPSDIFLFHNVKGYVGVKFYIIFDDGSYTAHHVLSDTPLNFKKGISPLETSIAYYNVELPYNSSRASWKFANLSENAPNTYEYRNVAFDIMKNEMYVKSFYTTDNDLKLYQGVCIVIDTDYTTTDSQLGSNAIGNVDDGSPNIGNGGSVAPPGYTQPNKPGPGSNILDWIDYWNECSNALYQSVNSSISNISSATLSVFGFISATFTFIPPQIWVVLTLGIAIIIILRILGR